MDAELIYAIESGIENFLNSEECSIETKKRIESEHTDTSLKQQHFHDLTTVLVATLSSFIAGLAANIASAYFEKKILSEKEAEAAAREITHVRWNEIRLKFGEKALKNCSLTEIEVSSLAIHVREACKKVEE